MITKRCLITAKSKTCQNTPFCKRSIERQMAILPLIRAIDLPVDALGSLSSCILTIQLQRHL